MVNSRDGARTEIDSKSVNTSVHFTFDELESVWQRMERRGDCYAFQSFRWLKNWHALVGTQLSIKACLVLVEYPVGTPLMILPLGIQKRGPVSCLIWLGGALSDYLGPLLSKNCSASIDSGTFADIWENVRTKLPPFDAILFERQPEKIAGQDNPFIFPNCEAHTCNAHFTQLSGTLDSFIDSKRTTKWQAKERRKERRLADRGAVRFVVATGKQDIERILPEMIRQKRRSYQQIGARDLFSEKGYREFIYRMSEQYIEDSFVYLCGLTVDDRFVATSWGLVYKQRFYHLLTTYEQNELTKYSPGNIMLRYMFDWALTNDIRIFDFTSGDDSYKSLWCDQELKLYDYFHSITLTGFIYIELTRLKRKLKTIIKTSPLLLKIARKLRALLPRLKSGSMT